MPESVQRHFSQHVVAAENLPSGRARLTITPSQQHQHPDWPGTTTTFDADAVIGCDGVKSAVRGSLGLGDGQDGPEDAAPAGGASGGGQRAAGSKAHGGGRVRYTGTYAYRGLLDMDAAVRENGEGARVPALWVAPGKVTPRRS
jgi:salicylate hydroxylase